MPCKCYNEDLPCCWNFVCEAAYTTSRISLCIHCGAEMQKDEIDVWRHYSQMELPLEERQTWHIIEPPPL
jgi:hypothetical protein